MDELVEASGMAKDESGLPEAQKQAAHRMAYIRRL